MYGRKRKADEQRKAARGQGVALREAARKYTQLSLRADVCGYFGGQLFQKDLETLTPKERVDTYLKMLPFAFPRLQASSIDVQEAPAGDGRLSRLARLSLSFGAGEGSLSTDSAEEAEVVG
ncbi:MAG: hypothetical protein LUC33_00555 [Prevotellaceae bacterium]|nr:hypothetical protein [Prevotellaceae bacterium]